jgi:CheY-like chemotaxis protein
MAENANGPLRQRLLCATWSEFHAEMRLPSLPQTKRGAKELAETLQLHGTLEDEPILLSDRDSTSFMNALDDFLSVPSKLAIIYLASHGMLPTATEPLYRLATGDTRGPNDLVRSLPITEVLRTIDAKSERTLLIIDSCYSGRSSRELMGKPATFDESPGGHQLCILASSSPYEPSIAIPNAPLTEFSHELLEILRAGIPARNHLSVDDVHDAIRKVALGRSLPQPWVFSQGTASKVPFFANMANRTDAEAQVEDRVEVGTEAFDHRAAILYIDDEPVQLASFKDAVEAYGHEVTCASDPQDARDLLDAGFYDIIVVDLFLSDELPATDLLDYVNKTAKESIILIATRRSKSSEDNWERLAAIFTYPTRVSALLFKPDYVDRILDIADGIRDERLAVLSRVKGVESSVPLVAGRIIRRRLADESSSETLQLQARICVQRLVARWFSSDEGRTKYLDHLSMEAIDSGRSSSSVFTMIPSLNEVEPSALTTLILKIGPRNEIAEEVDRFNRFVQVGVPLDMRTDRIASTTVGALGGVIYSLRGSGDGLIEEVGQLDDDAIAQCLRTLFDPAHKRWYASELRGEGMRPMTYFKSLGFDARSFGQIARELNQSIAKSKVVADFGQVKDNFYEDALMLKPHRATLVHGDLSLSNIVRTGPDRFAIIDYRSVGIGPRLIDFARIEVELWLRALAPEGPRDERFRLAHAAMSKRLVEDFPADPVADWLTASYNLAMICRRLATENFAGVTDAEYGSILWLTTVRRAALRGTTAAERRTLEVVPAALALTAQAMVEG